MKTITILLLSLLFCVGCGKKNNPIPFNVWIIKNDRDVTLEVNSSPTSLSLFASIVKSAVKDNNYNEITIYVSKDVEISKVYHVVDVAKKYDIKTIHIKLDQTPPPKPQIDPKDKK